MRRPATAAVRDQPPVRDRPPVRDHPQVRDRPPLRDRVTAHLGRLAAAGIEYRPLDGPRPWQQGGTGPRRHHAGHPAAEVTRHLAELAGDDKTRGRKSWPARRAPSRMSRSLSRRM